MRGGGSTRIKFLDNQINFFHIDHIGNYDRQHVNNDDGNDDDDDDDDSAADNDDDYADANSDDDDDDEDDLREVKFWDCPLLITQDSPATPHLINRSPIFQLVKQAFAKKKNRGASSFAPKLLLPGCMMHA